MNSFLNYTLVAVISFSLGVMAVMTIDSRNSYAAPSRVSAPKTLTTRNPFFIKVKESGNKILHSFSRPVNDGSIQSAADYAKLAAKINDFLDKSYEELNKKFKLLKADDKDPRVIMQKNHLRDSLEYMFSENELWYKAVIDDDFSGTKNYLFFHYYPCDYKKPRPGMKLEEICFVLDNSIIKGDEWFPVSESFNVPFMVWSNDTPHVRLQFDRSAKMSNAIKAIIGVIPAPNEQFPIHYLQFNSGKFTWREGKEVKWQLASEKEFKKFIKWAEEEGYKHNDTYEE